MSSTETSTAYDNATSQFLIALDALAVQQYRTGIADPTYDGTVTPPAGWKQIASFKAPEVDLGKAVDQFLTLHPTLRPRVAALTEGVMDEQLRADVTAALTDPATQQALSVGVRDVYFGFALVPDPTAPTPGNSNVVAIRGTQTGFEWALDATAIQVPVPLAWFSDGRLTLARAHLGFLILFAMLYEQVSAATAQFGTETTSYFTGHSLGAALSTLAALASKLKSLFAPMQMYNYASPRVGDPTFVSAYNFFLPQSWRVVNLADIVPVLPPTSLSLDGGAITLCYAHVGEEVSYLWQDGNVAENHELLITYVPTVKQGTVSTTQPTYPTTAICP